jgi:hypothetical protein
MDDILIILLTLVLTIVAAINQSKKKKQQLPDPETKEPDFWEEILQGRTPRPHPMDTDEMDHYPEPVRKPEPVVVPKQPARPIRNNPAVNPTMQFNLPKEGERNENSLRQSEIRSALEASGENAGEEKSLLEDFSLKKAVIYSEIIHPKYF